MIKQFKDNYFFLSNFYPCKIVYDGLEYTSAEAAFQSAKTLNMNKRKIFCDLNPHDAKIYGRRLKLRLDWEYTKDQIMEEIIRCKFRQNSDLLELLINTGDQQLIEGNEWKDAYWGVILSSGIGKNKLGKILMKIRSEYDLSINK